jgi:hypothetical protein
MLAAPTWLAFIRSSGGTRPNRAGMALMCEFDKSCLKSLAYSSKALWSMP